MDCEFNKEMLVSPINLKYHSWIVQWYAGACFMLLNKHHVCWRNDFSISSISGEVIAWERGACVSLDWDPGSGIESILIAGWLPVPTLSAPLSLNVMGARESGRDVPIELETESSFVDVVAFIVAVVATDVAVIVFDVAIVAFTVVTSPWLTTLE